MGRPHYAEERNIEGRIYHEIASAGREGVRFNDLLRRSAVSRDTLWKKLPKFKSLGLVRHEHGRYISNRPVDNYSKVPNPNYPFITKIDRLPSHAKTTDEMLNQIDNEFVRVYRLYIVLLQMIVKQKNATAAHDYFEFFFAHEIMPLLDSVALTVWQKREMLKIDADLLLPTYAAMLFRPKSPREMSLWVEINEARKTNPRKP